MSTQYRYLGLAALPLVVLLFRGRKTATTQPTPEPPPEPATLPEYTGPLPPDLGTVAAWPLVQRIAQGWRVPQGWWWYYYSSPETDGVNALFKLNSNRVRIERVLGDNARGWAVVFKVTDYPSGMLWTLSRLPQPAWKGKDTDESIVFGPTR